MIIMKPEATDQQITEVVRETTRYGLKADVTRGASTVINLVGDQNKVPFTRLAVLPGVQEARMVDIPYRLISREYTGYFDKEMPRRVIRVGDVAIGGDEPVFIAGPCAVESKQQLFRIAEGGGFIRALFGPQIGNVHITRQQDEEEHADPAVQYGSLRV